MQKHDPDREEPDDFEETMGRFKRVFYMTVLTALARSNPNDISIDLPRGQNEEYWKEELLPKAAGIALNNEADLAFIAERMNIPIAEVQIHLSAWVDSK